jgi:hypothetical protein
MLRLAVLLGGDTVPAWLHRGLADVVRTDAAEIVLAIQDATPPAPPRRRPSAFRTYERLDRGFFFFPDDHSASVPLGSLLRGSPVLRAAPVRTRTGFELDAPDVAAIREHAPDVLLNLGFPPLGGAVLDAARLGMWTFDHLEREKAGRPAFAWEMLHGRPATETCLCATTSRSSVVLQRSWATTDLNSLHRSRNAALWKSSAFLGRALRGVPAGARVDETLPVPEWDAPSREPGPLDLARFVAGVARRVARTRWRSRRSDYVWFVAARPSGPSLVDGSLEGFAPVPMPADRFYADPFVVEDEERHWLFLEDADRASGKGSIRCAELRSDGSLGASEIVLERPYHLSYPFVFAWRGEWYMIPESAENRTIELWRARDFPWRWELDSILFKDVVAVDSTILEHDGRLWLFTSTSDTGGAPQDELSLFHATSLHGDWTPHPRNPIVSDLRRARPAGRVFRENGQLYRPGQDCSGEYGSAIWLHRIERLDEHDYRETPVRRIDADWWPGARGTHSIARAGAFDVIDGRIWLRRGQTVAEAARR